MQDDKNSISLRLHSNEPKFPIRTSQKVFTGQFLVNDMFSSVLYWTLRKNCTKTVTITLKNSVCVY